MTHDSGLIRIRSMAPRRSVLKGIAAGSTLAATGIPFRSAAAATEVTMICWQGYDDGLRADSYLADNDIAVNATYIGSNDEILAKIQGGGMGTIDIVTPYMGYVPLMVAAGMLEPIDVSKIPNFEKILPVFQNDPNINVAGQLYAVPFTWGSAPMLYDPAALDFEPKGWGDLMRPEVEGKIGISDDPLGNITLAAIMATDAEVATEITHAQLDQAIEYLIEIKKRSRVVTTSWGELADAMARGDVAITFSGWESMKKFVADKGKSVEYIYPEEGTFAWLDNYCIVKDAPNIDLDHELSDKILSVPAQKALAEDAGQGIVTTEAIAALTPEAAAIYPYDDMEGFNQFATFFPFPPLEPEGDLATIDDWLTAYERFKSA